MSLSSCLRVSRTGLLLLVTSNSSLQVDKPTYVRRPIVRHNC